MDTHVVPELHSSLFKHPKTPINRDTLPSSPHALIPRKKKKPNTLCSQASKRSKKNASTNATHSASPPFLPNNPPSLLSTNLNRRFTGPYLFSIQRHRLHPLRLRRNIIPRNLLRLPRSLRQRRTK